MKLESQASDLLLNIITVCSLTTIETFTKINENRNTYVYFKRTSHNVKRNIPYILVHECAIKAIIKIQFI